MAFNRNRMAIREFTIAGGQKAGRQTRRDTEPMIGSKHGLKLILRIYALDDKGEDENENEDEEDWGSPNP
jgi:hypothetical protein